MQKINLSGRNGNKRKIRTLLALKVTAFDGRQMNGVQVVNYII